MVCTSEERLQGLIQLAMDAIIAVDEQQRIVLFNRAAEQMFRCPANEVLGTPLDRFIPPRVCERHRQHIQDFGRHGVTARRMGALGELTALRADGEEFPIEASISQAEVAGQKLFTVILRDISERKHAEAERRALTLLPEQNPDPVLRLAKDCALLYANAASTALLRQWGVAVGGTLAPAQCDEMLDTLRSGEVKEFAVPCGDRVYSLLSVPVPAAGYVNVYGRDLTERLRMEADLRQALADKEMLLREVHHRTKNSLQMLGDLLFLQAETLSGSAEKQALQDSYARVLAIARLHEQLYQALEHGRIRVADYLHRLIAGFANVHPGVTFRLNAPREPITLDADRAIHVGLLVNELATNAAKHAFEGRQGEVTVGVAATGETLELQVRDNGKGLPANLDVAQTKSLGLRIVQTLLRGLHGSLHTANRGGAVFTIRMPLHPEG